MISGAGPSPFLLNGTLRDHIEEYKKEDPEFVHKLMESFYVDDLATGSPANVMHFTSTRKLKTDWQKEDLSCKNGKATIRNWLH